MYKSGYIAIIGRPNAGKSTLINRIIEEKVSIVSWRPQTTRNKILGISSGEDYQAIFIDTPGIHPSKNKLSDMMTRSINSSVSEVDAVLYMIDGTANMSDIDIDYLNNYSLKAPLIVALNKVDDANISKYAATLNKLNAFSKVRSFYAISAKTGENVDKLKDELISLLPEGEKLYPEDIYTDRSLRFLVAEIIREKALFFLNQEIPYGVGVMITKFEERQDKDITEIEADLISDKQQHKAIIIGKGGAMIKKISEAARADIERLLGRQVFIKVFVKVIIDWRDNTRVLEELGYFTDSY